MGDVDDTIVYEVPKVIVIGAESSGKSSLLENITKCPIFPRNTSICTRQPIHLKLSKLEEDENPEYKIIYENNETLTTKTKIVFLTFKFCTFRWLNLPFSRR